MRETRSNARMAPFFLNHWRLLAGTVAGIAGWAAAAWIQLPTTSHLLIGWDFGALVYLALVWRLFLTAEEAKVRASAAREDESRTLLLLIILTAIAASLVAVVAAMIAAKGQAEAIKAFTAVCAGVTLVLSWLVLQSVFVSHYAHRHFSESSSKTGFGFSGQPARTYRDFIYLSFCIGATFQVSDNEVRTSQLRNLVTAHAATAYFYNTAILALGINIIAGVVGK